MNKDIRGAKIHQIKITPVSMSETIILLRLTVFVFSAFFIFPSSVALPRDDTVDGGVF